MSVTLMTASIIVGLVLSAYQTAGGVQAALKNDDINKWATKVANAINSNTDLKNKILEAYNDKNYKLGNALISQSPIGSAYKNLQNEMEDLKKNKDKKIEEIDENTRELEKAQANLAANQASGETVSDIWQSQPSQAAAQAEKAITSSNDLVSGGIKNV